MKVILLFPGISGIGLNSYGQGMEESWISHGLSSISSCLKQAGYAAELIDLRCLKSWKDFEHIIAEKKPDVVGVTMMSVDYNPALRSIAIIKKVSPKTIIVVGGCHPTLMTDEVEKEENIDYIITGEGEISFIDLLKNIESGRETQRIIKGIPPEDLDGLPFIDRELFRGFDYPLPLDGFSRPFVTIIAGRGCKFNCNYCQPAERIIFGKTVRRRSPQSVLQELIVLKKKYAFKSLMIHDDCLTEDKGWVIEFCRLYKKNGFDQPFVCQSRADLICQNEDMIDLMSKSGLKLMFIGFESGNQRVLNFLRKGTKVEDNYKAARICKEHGIKIWANYMFGCPTETKEEVMDTVKMIKDIKPDHCSPAFYTPHPGSDLFAYCQKNRLSLIKNHDSYRRNATEAKIKGVDYSFLYMASLESTGFPMPWKNSFLLFIGSKFLFFIIRYRFARLILKKISERFILKKRE